MAEWIATASRQLRVSVLVEARYLMQPQLADAIAALHAAGHDVDLVVADRHVADLAAHADVDVVLARGRSPALVSLLRAAEAAGIPVANPAAAVSAVVDKAGMGAALAAAGVPVPRTWVGPVDALARWADLEFPLVLKPVFGDNARGLVVVRSRAELTTVPWPEPVALVQTFHRGDGVDLKLYVVGDRAWAVRRPSPVDAAGALRSVTTAGDPVPVTPALAELALRCGQLLGLRIYGIDCVDGADGPLVVEVNDFPNYRGAVGASEAIADLVADLALIPAGAP